VALTKITGEGVGAVDGLTVGTTASDAGASLTVNKSPVAAHGNPLVQVGGSTFTSGGYYTVGLGFTNSTYTEPPAEIAYVSKSDSGGTKGDIVFGTRDATTNTAVSTRMTINSSGNVLVGKTASAENTAGTELNANGYALFVRDGDRVAMFNRTSDNGEVIRIAKDGTTVGIIGTEGGDPTIGRGDSAIKFKPGNNAIIPWNINTNASRDSATDLGMSSDRFEDIFATNTTIQSSDQNEKQQIASLTTAEITAAKALSKLFKTFKWNSAVTAKGDAARTHTGHIAQEVQTAMSDAGLDASKYAFWCSDTWWETSTEVAAVEADEEAGIEAKDAYTRIDTYQTADDAPDGATQRTRLGVRYPELLAFIGAATEQRLADIETRLTALEGS